MATAVSPLSDRSRVQWKALTSSIQAISTGLTVPFVLAGQEVNFVLPFRKEAFISLKKQNSTTPTQSMISPLSIGPRTKTKALSSSIQAMSTGSTVSLVQYVW